MFIWVLSLFWRPCIDKKQVFIGNLDWMRNTRQFTLNKKAVTGAISLDGSRKVQNQEFRFWGGSCAVRAFWAFLVPKVYLGVKAMCKKFHKVPTLGCDFPCVNILTIFTQAMQCGNSCGLEWANMQYKYWILFNPSLTACEGWTMVESWWKTFTESCNKSTHFHVTQAYTAGADWMKIVFCLNSGTNLTFT